MLRGEKTEEEKTFLLDENVEHMIFYPNSTPKMSPKDLDSSLLIQLPFSLDLFQIESIKAVNANKSVLTIASTSAGKSVVAYQAIGLSLSHQMRAIYTAPVKSLANQKFSDLQKLFDNVGIITGDVSTNPNADVIVMTAEVLRNHVYSRSSLLMDVEHIVLDEAHYLGDPGRGVVWEQILISSPSHIKFILLSATLPNVTELAQWLSICRKTSIHTIIQHKRPVPLRIHALTSAKKSTIIKEGDSCSNYEQIEKLCSETTEGIMNLMIPKDPAYYSIANYANEIMENGYAPLIIFCLSKKKCIDIANSIVGTPGYSPINIFDEASKTWPNSITQSPQYSLVRSFVSKGVGIHHSGIIPIIRETIELLFAAGQLSILVATETFSLGVNAPARAVFFSSLVKWGGNSYRYLHSSEFLQMAGRAGRRGSDEYGDVFIYIPDGCPSFIIKSIIDSKSERLVSRMRITPWFVISSLSFGYDPKQLIDQSFLRYQENIEQERLKTLLSTIQPPTEKEKRASDFSAIMKEIVSLFLNPKNIRKIITPGRLVYIIHEGVIWDWCSIHSLDGKDQSINVYATAIRGTSSTYVPSKDIHISELFSISFPISSIVYISSVKINNPSSGTESTQGPVFAQILSKVIQKYKSIPFLLSADIPYGKERLVQLKKNLDNVGVPTEEIKDIISLSGNSDRYTSIASKISSLDGNVYNNEISAIIQELFNLKFVEENHVLTIKGRIAEQLRIENPILIVEMLFNGIFSTLDLKEVCIVVSCFVESPPTIKVRLSPVQSALWNQVKNEAQKLRISTKSTIHKSLMPFVAQYLDTGKIQSIDETTVDPDNPQKQLSAISEGMAVRYIKRVQEILLLVAEASKSMQVIDLETRIRDAEKLLHTGTKLDASLYRVE